MSPIAENEFKVWARFEKVFAARMRQARADAGISQAALARKLSKYGIDLDATAITRIEKNADVPARSIRLGEAAAIAEVLGFDLLDSSPKVGPDAALRERNRQYGKASETIGQLRNEVARLRSEARGGES